eukprot:3339757-Pyramimonas_sp.AAC.1
MPPEASRLERRKQEIQTGCLQRYGTEDVDWDRMASPPRVATTGPAPRQARRAMPGLDGLGPEARLASPAGVQTLALALQWRLAGPPMRQAWNFSASVLPARGARGEGRAGGAAPPWRRDKGALAGELVQESSVASPITKESLTLMTQWRRGLTYVPISAFGTVNLGGLVRYTGRKDPPSLMFLALLS